MANIPEADYSAHDVNFKLTQGHHTDITFDYQTLDMTGWTALRFLWNNFDGTNPVTVTSVLTTPADGFITVTFDAATWALIGGVAGGDFQLDILDTSGNRRVLATGNTSHELTKD